MTSMEKVWYLCVCVFKIYSYFICMSTLTIGMSVCSVHVCSAHRGKKRQQSVRGCEPLHGCWELKPGRPPGQSAPTG